MNIRNIQINDFYLDYLNLLKQLSILNEKEISFKDFNNFCNNLNDNHLIKVIELNDKIIASGTLLIETKILHNFGKVGHIEDIVVDENVRGMNIGKKIVEYLIDLAYKKGCYKVILNCNENNSKFYEKCGFKKKEIEMVKYFYK
jgi:glucosamine-phosphate N-acetyltransferase